MQDKLYIPTELHVGQQDRAGTYTGRLGYIVYKDAKGKLRKEKSWNGWRDHKIDPVITDNEPMTGFTLNKGIARGGYDWYSQRTEKVRVYDPRGFEFEISIDNLLGVLMHSDVSKRDIVQACVYAWAGTELVLLPTNTEDYEASSKHTSKQTMKVGARELVVGHTYELKSGKENVVYVGKYTIFGDKNSNGDRNNRYEVVSKTQVEKKNQHIFYHLENKQFEVKAPTTYIAQVVSEEMHPEFAEVVDKFFKQKMSQKIKSLRVIPKQFKDMSEYKGNEYYQQHYGPERQGYYYVNDAKSDLFGYEWMEVSPNEFIRVYIAVDMFVQPINRPTFDPVLRQYVAHPNAVWGLANVEVTWIKSMRFDPETRTTFYSLDGSNHYYSDRVPPVHIDGLTADSDKVKAAINKIKTNLENALNGWICKPTDNCAIDDELKGYIANLSAAMKQFKLGEIRAVLPTGTIAFKQYDRLGAGGTLVTEDDLDDYDEVEPIVVPTEETV